MLASQQQHAIATRDSRGPWSRESRHARTRGEAPVSRPRRGPSVVDRVSPQSARAHLQYLRRTNPNLHDTSFCAWHSTVRFSACVVFMREQTPHRRHIPPDRCATNEGWHGHICGRPFRGQRRHRGLAIQRCAFRRKPQWRWRIAYARLCSSPSSGRARVA